MTRQLSFVLAIITALLWVPAAQAAIMWDGGASTLNWIDANNWNPDGVPPNGSQIQFNPLIVKGVLYGASPSLRYFALDAATGEELWSFDPGVAVEAWTSSRGAVYWQGGEDERLIVGAGPYLHALDARTGRLINSFSDSLLKVTNTLKIEVNAMRNNFSICVTGKFITLCYQIITQCFMIFDNTVVHDGNIWP